MVCMWYCCKDVNASAPSVKYWLFFDNYQNSEIVILVNLFNIFRESLLPIAKWHLKNSILSKIISLFSLTQMRHWKFALRCFVIKCSSNSSRVNFWSYSILFPVSCLFTSGGGSLPVSCLFTSGGDGSFPVSCLHNLQLWTSCSSLMWFFNLYSSDQTDQQSGQVFSGSLNR